MAKKPAKNHAGHRGDPISAYPLSAEQLVRGIFQIKPEDVRRINVKRSGKGKTK